jgi:hypothetical protein
MGFLQASKNHHRYFLSFIRIIFQTDLQAEPVVDSRNDLCLGTLDGDEVEGNSFRFTALADRKFGGSLNACITLGGWFIPTYDWTVLRPTGKTVPESNAQNDENSDYF